MSAAALTDPARGEPRITAAAAGAFALLLLSAALAALLGSLLDVAPATPNDSIEESPGAVACLIAHNAAVALLPLALLALGWDRLGPLASLTDGLIAVSVIANGAVIGLGFARAGSKLWAFLPHLPLEWAAIALGAGAWCAFRLRPPSQRRQALLAVLVAASLALCGAAVLEAYATPVGA